MIRIRILKKISKKIMALIITISMLFSNVMPLATVFALTNEEKANLVELRMRGASGIDIDNGEATIHYTDGDVIVSGADLHHEQNDNWNFGDHTGVMHFLYTSSTNLTFHFESADGLYAAYRVDGGNQEEVENNELTLNDLQTFSQRPQGYDIEFEFFGRGENPLPMPNGTTYEIDFGNASWDVNGTVVTASIQGIADLTDGFVEVVDSDVIHLNNFDPNTMEVRVSAAGGFNTELHVDDYNLEYTTCLAWTLNGILPTNDDLYFVVQPKPQNQDGMYLVEFGDAEWDIDGEHVSASLEGLDMILNNGPVEIDDHTAIHLEGFNPETMEVRIVVPFENGKEFSTRLYVDNSNNTSLDAVGQDVHVPNNGVIFFNVQRIGDNGGGPGNPPQEGNTTATIRVNGTDGSYMEWVEDPEGGHEEPRDYDGGGAICNELKFNINGGAIWGLEPEGEKFDDLGWFQHNEIEYQYDEEEGDTTVVIGLFTEWHRKITSVSINDASYQVGIDYEDKSDWIAHVAPERPEFVGYYVTVPKANDNIYKITVQIDPNAIQYVSEFNWTNDPERMYMYDPEDHIITDEHDNPIISSEYIEHAKLEIIGAQFEIGNQSYNYDGTDFSKSFNDDYIDFSIDNNGKYAGGHLVVPSDTVVTARITPDPGYQLEDVRVLGNFEATDTPYVYRFTLPVHREDFRLVLEPNDNIEVNYDDDFDDFSINFATATTINGNYELYVDEPELTAEQINAFETYAGNYNIVNYFNIELNQFINNISIVNDVYDYNGWDIPITNLNKKATMTFTLHESINADSIIVIRSNGDGTFETIAPTFDGNVMAIETKKFGDFAIATMNLESIEEVDIMVTAPTPGVKVNVTMQHDPVTNEDYPVGNPTPEATAPDNAHYYVDEAAWLNGTCNGGANLCNEFFNGTFDQNNTYFAGISIVPEEGYRFTYDTLNNLTVNGHELDTDNRDQILYVAEDGSQIVIIVGITTEEMQTMKGDMNNNGRIDLADIIALLRKYLNDDATAEEIQIGDMDNNGSIGLKDIIDLLRLYLNS